MPTNTLSLRPRLPFTFLEAASLDLVRRKVLAVLLLTLGSRSLALEIRMDAMAPVFPSTRSEILQIEQDFGGWGLALAPEWIHAQWGSGGFLEEDEMSITEEGFGLWASVYVRPEFASRKRGMRLGAYVRTRSVRQTLDRLHPGETDHVNDATVWALGTEFAWTFLPLDVLVVEPYVRMGRSHVSSHWVGPPPERDMTSVDAYSETWKGDLRMGTFVGIRF